MSTYRREHYLAKLRPFYNDSGLSVRFKNDIPKEIFDLIIEKYKKYDKRSTERLMAYAKAMRISRQVEQIGLE